MLQSFSIDSRLELNSESYKPGDTFYISCCKTGSVHIKDIIKDKSIDVSSLNPGSYKFTRIAGDEVKHCNFEKI